MAAKKTEENNNIFLVVDKEELKFKISERLKLGNDILERSINNQEEKSKAWDDFIDWNKYNEELIRQAFNKPQNRYIYEYEYKASIGSLFGRPEQKSFKEWVIEDKNHIGYQVRKLKWFFDNIDLFKSGEKITKTDDTKSSLSNLVNILKRFHKISQALRHRHNNRETILIKDEYDVQDFLYGLVQIHFDDVRKEDYSPSNSGANARIDFVLKKEKIILEIKMTSESLTTKKLGDELLIDIGRYKEYPNCDDLVIFVYDKGDFIRNKQGFITDLQKQTTNSLKITVIINPE